MIEIDKDKCSGCCGCVDHCPVAAINVIDDEVIIDNDICIGPARHLLLHNGFASAKGAGNRTLAPFEQRKKGIQNTLTSD